jgi:hypothetical protein
MVVDMVVETRIRLSTLRGDWNESHLIWKYALREEPAG